MPLIDDADRVSDQRYTKGLPSRTLLEVAIAHSHYFARRDCDQDGSRAELFKPLEFKESRKRSLWMSLAVHGALLSVLLLIPLIFTDAIKIKYDAVLIAPPLVRQQVLEVTHYKQPAPPKPVIDPTPLVAPPPVKPLLVQPPGPKPAEPLKIAEVKLPEVNEREKPALIRNSPRLESAEPAPAPPKIEVRTGIFSTGSPVTPTTNLPAARVQTGGFGDPNGIKGDGKPRKLADIASLGSFDLPVGPGAGNGTGGSHGVKGTGASAGGRAFSHAGFGDAAVAKPDAPKRRADVGLLQTPVEILFKPKPDYTEEARKLKLEGEVLARILFTAGGEVRVLDVVRGLGHGLDESATRAAEQIKFKPAQRDGQPVDSMATVHIVFQLAY